MDERYENNVFMSTTNMFKNSKHSVEMQFYTHVTLMCRVFSIWDITLIVAIFHFTHFSGCKKALTVRGMQMFSPTHLNGNYFLYYVLRFTL